MKLNLFFPSLAFFAAAIGFSGPILAQSALQTLQGELGRVVILDASGSMRNLGFRRPERSRMEVGREFLTEIMSELLEQDDRIKTGLIVFGANQNLTWDSVSATYGGNPMAYPNSGPLCRDTVVKMPFSTISRGFVDRVETIGQATEWGGMTPIHVSINQALASFDPRVGGQIILVSDMSQPNCLPAGAETICDAIEPLLRKIRSNNGVVSAIVFETPTATAREALSECIWTTTHPAPLINLDVEEIVQTALNAPEFTPELIAGGANNLDPQGIDVSDAVLTLRPQGRVSIIANGPFGKFKLPVGNYDINGTLDNVSWASNITISGPTSMRTILEPSELKVWAQLAGGSTPVSIDLEISRPGGPILARVSGYAPGDTLELANGDYLIAGTTPTGAKAQAIVTMELGASRDATLSFLQATSTTTSAINTFRDVTINVNFVQPTLDTGQSFAPAVTISGPSWQSHPLTSSGFAGQMDVGSYTVEISGARIHRLPLTVRSGQNRLLIDINITPGWFVARTNGLSGLFELRDSSGKGLFSFDGSEVIHSLVDGSYQLSMTRDGRTTSQNFEITAGQKTVLRPF